MLKACGQMLFCLLIVLSYSVSAQQTTASDKVVTIAAEDNWPPFSDERGRGLSTAIVSAAFKLAGYQIKTIAVPYARALYYTEAQHHKRLLECDPPAQYRTKVLIPRHSTI